MEADFGPRKTVAWVAAVLLVAALARLTSATLLVPAWESRARRAPFPDLYPTLAASLVDRHTLGYAPLGAPITTARGPAFPLWLALPMTVGVRDDRTLAWWATVPGLFGAALAAWIARRATSTSAGPWVAAGAAAIASLHPLPLFASSRGMSDEFCGVLGLAGLAAWRQAETSPRHAARWTALAGAALGAAMLTRATAALFLLALLAAPLLARASVRRALVVAVLALLPPLAWSVRSSMLEGRPVFVHSLAAYNFWLGEALDRFGFSAHHRDTLTLAHTLMVAEGGLPATTATATLWYVTFTPAETGRLERTLGQAALRRIAREPGSYARRVLKGMAWFWVRGETTATTARYATVALPFLALTVLGTLRWGRGPRDALGWALILTVVLHVLFYAAVCPMARYSVAVYPCCAALAALGLTRLRYSGAAGVSPP